MATETRAGARESGLPPSARATHTTPVGAGYLPSPVPHDLLAGVSASHRRLLALAAALDDATVARPSLLPGWTVGHLLHHLTVDAHGHTNVVQAACAGAAPVPLRDTGPTGPDAGAASAAERLHADLAAAIAGLERAWDTAHVEVWRTGLGRCRPEPADGAPPDGPVTLSDLVFLRWREVEIHGVDLGLADRGGPGWADLPAPYVDTEWDWTTARLPERLPPGVSVVLAPGDRPSRAFGAGSRPAVVRTSTAETLRWLLGRLPRPAAPRGWPELRSWE
ncbi:maleylpyruvate isomerase family mycothiol-dependent enzyme [Pseudofrankia sp. DC12]|uniref:maleylpyruvate isomerase family mycothiol-dependent enzyme n=1 Tax=Pseudofrankia sp. DC12 TaxID=683315 RepID=UPI0005F81F03|nr:maleylpyruvate isomerase family mycothiol-dependent enzyme [Pseudofrankia sp. DC12]